VKRRPYIPGVYGIDSLADFDFSGEEDELALRRAARELRRWLNRQQKRVRRIGSEDRYWLRRYAQIEAWEQQTAKEENATSVLLNSYRAAMHNELQTVWLRQRLAEAEERGRELARELTRSIVREERKEFARRGILRGRRK
jgi:DNA topoisomerase VI subunit B